MTVWIPSRKNVVKIKTEGEAVEDTVGEAAGMAQGTMIVMIWVLYVWGNKGLFKHWTHNSTLCLISTKMHEKNCANKGKVQIIKRLDFVWIIPIPVTFRVLSALQVVPLMLSPICLLSK